MEVATEEEARVGSRTSPGKEGDEAGLSGDRPALAAARRRPRPERPHRLRRAARRGPQRLPGYPADVAGVPGGRERGGQRGQPALAPGRPRGPPARRGLPARAHGQPGGASQQAGRHRLRPGQALQAEGGRRAARGPLQQPAEGGRPQWGLKPLPRLAPDSNCSQTFLLSPPLSLSPTTASFLHLNQNIPTRCVGVFQLQT